MSTFEILFTTFYVSAAIIWSSYLIADVAADIKKMANWTGVISSQL